MLTNLLTQLPPLTHPSPLVGQSFVSKAAVGTIVGLHSAQIQQMASEYEEKVCERERSLIIVTLSENEAVNKSL